MYPISFQDKAKNILAGWAICVLVVFIVCKIFDIFYFGYNTPDFSFVIAEQPKLYQKIFQACIFAPLWEEALFRHFPFQILKVFPHREKLLWPVILGTSFIFGYMHGHSYNVGMQGLVGVVFAHVYIRNGYSYWSSVALHSLYNLTLTIGLVNL